ncbi:two-component system chemotaxis sensor kinase CheA [Desulfitispora alkaliphila]|uniref:chemotaxis protein CheA n=1 Tax=Desulfitispora alkaliphila TaxID=622674 RepID=UPI003D1F76E6
MIDEDLISTFLEETGENLQLVEEGLLALENNPRDQEQIDLVFRAMHTIKGGAGLMGFERISHIAHHLENVLEQIREMGTGISDNLFGVLLEGTDLIKKIMDSDDLSGSQFQDQIDNLEHALSIFQVEKSAKAGDGNEDIPVNEGKLNYYKVGLRFRSDIFETGTDPLMLLMEIEEQGRILCSFLNKSSLPPIHALDPYKLYVSWVVFMETEKTKSEIEDVFIFVQDENEINIEEITQDIHLWFDNNASCCDSLVDQGLIAVPELDSLRKKLIGVGESLYKEGKLKQKKDNIDQSNNQPKDYGIANTIRVDTNKLEDILNQIAELLIAQSRVKEMVSRFSGANKSLNVEIDNSFQEVDKIIRSIQEKVMTTSMIPIGGVFTRFQRMARDLARENGKEVELKLEGKETELDKKVIEQITDPLKHLLRNAIDHGLEKPEERVALGKPSKGTIELNAYHHEGNIVIEISDDGKGIDEDMVMSKALERGLIDPEQNFSSTEILNLLFKPGFSTAKEITDISGRGVGLDVVLTNIKSLRGSVELDTEKGKGTKFVVKLPLTLAIIDGMIVRVGEEKFVVPLNAIVEFVKISKENIKLAEGKGKLINLRDEFIPCTALYEILNIEPDFFEPSDGIVIVLKDGDRKLAVLLDEIIGQEQVVIKSIKENLEQVEGIAGATIMGDGSVAVIIDVLSLFRMSRNRK